MGATIIAGTTLGNPLETHFSIDGKPRSYVASPGGVITYTGAVRSPDRHVMVLADISATEASTIAALMPGSVITLQSDGLGGAVSVRFDFFEAIISSASGRGTGRVHYH